MADCAPAQTSALDGAPDEPCGLCSPDDGLCATPLRSPCGVLGHDGFRHTGQHVLLGRCRKPWAKVSMKRVHGVCMGQEHPPWYDERGWLLSSSKGGVMPCLFPTMDNIELRGCVERCQADSHAA